MGPKTVEGILSPSRILRAGMGACCPLSPPHTAPHVPENSTETVLCCQRVTYKPEHTVTSGIESKK